MLQTILYSLACPLDICHILPSSEIDLFFFCLFLQARKGTFCSEELADGVEYGKYPLATGRPSHNAT